MNQQSVIFELAYVISQMMKDVNRREWKVRIPAWVFLRGRTELLRNIPIKVARTVEDPISGDIIYRIEPQENFEKWLREEKENREPGRPGRVFDLE